MKVYIILFAVVAAAVAQQYADAPIPYSFNYASDTEDGGSSSHQEQGDGSGRVSGSYTVNNLEGHTRVVDYVADENGFRATVRTNEPGTMNLNPADVIMESTADSGYQAAPALRSAPAPAPARVAPSGGQGMRYVLVPVTDPRAAAAGYN